MKHGTQIPQKKHEMPRIVIYDYKNQCFFRLFSVRRFWHTDNTERDEMTTDRNIIFLSVRISPFSVESVCYKAEA